jgi:hypothetical protein
MEHYIIYIEGSSKKWINQRRCNADPSGNKRLCQGCLLGLDLLASTSLFDTLYPSYETTVSVGKLSGRQSTSGYILLLITMKIYYSDHNLEDASLYSITCGDNVEGRFTMPTLAHNRFWHANTYHQKIQVEWNRHLFVVEIASQLTSARYPISLQLADSILTSLSPPYNILQPSGNKPLCLPIYPSNSSWYVLTYVRMFVQPLCFLDRETTLLLAIEIVYPSRTSIYTC